MNNFQFVFLMGSMYIIGSFLANDITTTAGIFGFGFFWLWVAILLSKGVCIFCIADGVENE